MLEQSARICWYAIVASATEGEIGALLERGVLAVAASAAVDSLAAIAIEYCDFHTARSAPSTSLSLSAFPTARVAAAPVDPRPRCQAS